MTERQSDTAGLGEVVLSELRGGFVALKTQADSAVSQLEDDELFRTIGDESNSVAVIMRHVAGNMRSRWTAFLTSDGEKPDRNRDGEFELPPVRTRAALLADWEDGWRIALMTLNALRPDDLVRPVTIRGEPYTALAAIERATRHYAAHVGQIVFLAKHLAGPRWHTLSIPRARPSAARDTSN
jgi:hypothetical protein